ncbi:MAG: YfiR family protein [Gammaproteobacteria bacterium]|nr:YfiR family protein [Gammaproteobacteria bacterium]
MHKPLTHGFLAVLLLSLGICLIPTVHADEELEDKVKAAYLFHLVKFVDWPGLPPDELRICVYGSKSMADLMGELSNRKVKERTLKIDANDPSDPSRCQVVFIGRTEKRWHSLLEKTAGLPILTVSDHDGFARRGGMVGFYADGGKIRLEINPGVTHKANLRLSSKLLELARTVPAAKE